MSFENLLEKIQNMQSEAIKEREAEEATWFPVKGIRTSCTTGEEKEVDCYFSHKLSKSEYKHMNGSDGMILTIEKGGVTGYESCYVSDLIRGGYDVRERGWNACGGSIYKVEEKEYNPRAPKYQGTRILKKQIENNILMIHYAIIGGNNWDRLFIPPDSIKQVFEHFGINKGE